MSWLTWRQYRLQVIVTTAVLAAVGAAGALVTWWSGPVNAANANAFRAAVFDRQGIVPVGYALFAVALGIAAGAVLRRTLPAIAVTLSGFIGVRLAVAQLLRPHFLSPTTVYYSLTGDGVYFTPSGPSMLVAGGIVDRHRHVIPESGYFTSGTIINGVPSAYLSTACQKLAQVGTNPQKAIDACIQASGVRGYSSYQLAPTTGRSNSSRRESSWPRRPPLSRSPSPGCATGTRDAMTEQPGAGQPHPGCSR